MPDAELSLEYFQYKKEISLITLDLIKNNLSLMLDEEQ